MDISGHFWLLSCVRSASITRSSIILPKERPPKRNSGAGNEREDQEVGMHLAPDTLSRKLLKGMFERVKSLLTTIRIIFTASLARTLPLIKTHFIKDSGIITRKPLINVVDK